VLLPQRWQLTPILGERFTFHDLRAKSASDSASDQNAADRLGHGDVKLTRDTYGRLPRRSAALKIILDNIRQPRVRPRLTH
jgi:integrase